MGRSVKENGEEPDVMRIEKDPNGPPRIKRCLNRTRSVFSRDGIWRGLSDRPLSFGRPESRRCRCAFRSEAHQKRWQKNCYAYSIPTLYYVGNTLIPSNEFTQAHGRSGNTSHTPASLQVIILFNICFQFIKVF
jgi:hypothetical protein